jgi:hypothetical protein
MEPALKLKSISACLARPGPGLAIGVVTGFVARTTSCKKG